MWCFGGHNVQCAVARGTLGSCRERMKWAGTLLDELSKTSVPRLRSIICTRSSVAREHSFTRPGHREHRTNAATEERLRPVCSGQVPSAPRLQITCNGRAHL